MGKVKTIFNTAQLKNECAKFSWQLALGRVEGGGLAEWISWTTDTLDVSQIYPLLKIDKYKNDLDIHKIEVALISADGLFKKKASTKPDRQGYWFQYSVEASRCQP